MSWNSLQKFFISRNQISLLYLPCTEYIGFILVCTMQHLYLASAAAANFFKLMHPVSVMFTVKTLSEGGEKEWTHSGSQMVFATKKIARMAWLNQFSCGKKWEVGEQTHMELIYCCVKTESVPCMQCVTLHQAIILCVSQSAAIVKLFPLAKHWGKTKDSNPLTRQTWLRHSRSIQFNAAPPDILFPTDT